MSKVFQIRPPKRKLDDTNIEVTSEQPLVKKQKQIQARKTKDSKLIHPSEKKAKQLEPVELNSTVEQTSAEKPAEKQDVQRRRTRVSRPSNQSEEEEEQLKSALEATPSSETKEQSSDGFKMHCRVGIFRQGCKKIISCLEQAMPISAFTTVETFSEYLKSNTNFDTLVHSARRQETEQTFFISNQDWANLGKKWNNESLQQMYGQCKLTDHNMFIGVTLWRPKGVRSRKLKHAKSPNSSDSCGFSTPIDVADEQGEIDVSFDGKTYVCVAQLGQTRYTDLFEQIRKEARISGTNFSFLRADKYLISDNVVLQLAPLILHLE